MTSRNFGIGDKVMTIGQMHLELEILCGGESDIVSPNFPAGAVGNVIDIIGAGDTYLVEFSMLFQGLHVMMNRKLPASFLKLVEEARQSDMGPMQAFVRRARAVRDGELDRV